MANHYGECLTTLGRYPEAERRLVASYDKLNEQFGAEHVRTQDAVTRLVQLYEAWGAPEKAERYRELVRAPGETGS